MSTTPRPPLSAAIGAEAAAPAAPRAAARFLGRAAIEGAIIGALFALYNLGRLAILGEESTARDHAEPVRRVEAVLHLPSEAAIQSAIEAFPRIFELANHYYVTVHFPAMIAFLVWGFLARPRAEYVWARNVLIATTFLGLALHMTFPLAPPRMFPEWGFTDTMAVWGPSAYDGASAAIANQYAAMPSLHIGWALLIAYVVLRTGPRPLAVLAIAHAVVTVVVVVITANHWWVDGMVAATLLAVALLIFPRPRRNRLSRPGRSRPRRVTSLRREPAS